jgi:hypothetical protein
VKGGADLHTEGKRNISCLYWKRPVGSPLLYLLSYSKWQIINIQGSYLKVLQLVEKSENTFAEITVDTENICSFVRQCNTFTS